MAHYLKNGLFGSRARTLLLVAVIVAAIVLAWATRVFSQVQLGMPYAGKEVSQPGEFIYRFVWNKDRSAVTVSRNGADWVTITQSGSAFTLSDPTGTGKPITTFRSGAH